MTDIQSKRLNQALDAALEMTFPASDPVALTPYSSPSADVDASDITERGD